MGKKYEEQWKQRLKELKAYKKKHGDCLVPRNYEHNPKLGLWVKTQRVQYKKWIKGVHLLLTQERIDQLNEIDFKWEVGRTNKPNDTLWKKQFNKLIKYKKKHGDCLVPQNYKQNEQLGTWVMHQRREYKIWLNGVYARITKERIDQLNEIDFVWEVGQSHPNDTVWKQRFNELVKYKKKHGDCLVPHRYEANRKLGTWVGTQRYEYKKWLNGENTFITQDRIDQLNEIDFVWDARFERKSRESDKFTQEGSIPSGGRRNAVASNKSNRQRKRPIASKDRPKKRQRRRQSKDVSRELSPSERKERRRFALQALYNFRNPMQPDEVVSI